METGLSANGKWMLPPEDLDYIDEGGKLTASLNIPGCQARVVKYVAGDEIALHRHTGSSVKVVLRGAISFAGPDGSLGVAEAGMIYACGTGIYRGTVLRDSYLLVVEEDGSRAVPAS